jgi:hypothetical protein
MRNAYRNVVGNLNERTTWEQRSLSAGDANAHSRCLLNNNWVGLGELGGGGEEIFVKDP